MDDKAQRYKDQTQEREVLTKASLPETIPEQRGSDNSVLRPLLKPVRHMRLPFSVSENSHTTSSSVYGSHRSGDDKIPNFTPPQIEEKDSSSKETGSSNRPSWMQTGSSHASAGSASSTTSSTNAGDSLDVRLFFVLAEIVVSVSAGQCQTLQMEAWNKSVSTVLLTLHY